MRALVIAALLALAIVAAASPAPSGVPRLAHVVVILFENHDRGEVLGSGDAPTFDRLARSYADLTRYEALTHPSLPNYLALVSGSTQGISDDCTDCAAPGASIGSLLDRAHLSWGAYAEGYPGSPRFAKKHVPFLYFPRDRGHVHPLSALDRAHPPAFAFVTPDLCDDMHDCPVATGDRWLARFVPPLLRVPRTAVFVVFDEGSASQEVAALVLGTAVRAHAVDAAPTGHYALLRTVEDALGLPHLGASARAAPITGIWR